jgi:hypothetical protein
MQSHSDYVGLMLPVQLLAGPGVGLTVPSLLGAGTADLPSARFGTGSGVLNTARQIGTAVGVAALVGILTSVRVPSLGDFRNGVWLAAGFFAASAVVGAALLTKQRGSATTYLPDQAGAAVLEHLQPEVRRGATYPLK